MLSTEPLREMPWQAQKTNVIYYLRGKCTTAEEPVHITSNLNIFALVLQCTEYKYTLIEFFNGWNLIALEILSAYKLLTHPYWYLVPYLKLSYLII